MWNTCSDFGVHILSTNFKGLLIYVLMAFWSIFLFHSNFTYKKSINFWLLDKWRKNSANAENILSKTKYGTGAWSKPIIPEQSHLVKISIQREVFCQKHRWKGSLIMKNWQHVFYALRQNYKHTVKFPVLIN